MATVYFKGDALPRAQETHVTPAAPEKGDVFTLTINRKSISVTAGEDPTVESIVDAFVAAIGQFDNDIPEWAEVSASVGTDSTGAVTYLKLTGLDDGTPFTVTSGTTNASTFSVLVTEVRKGSAGQNQKQRVRVVGATGGTFKLGFPTPGGAATTSGFEETTTIAYNASAATVLSALEGTGAIASGDAAVILNATSDWEIEFKGAYANTQLQHLLLNGDSLTGAGRVDVTVLQEGSDYTPESYTLTFDTSGVSSFRFSATVDEGGTDVVYYSDWISPDWAAASVSTALSLANDIVAALESMTVTGGVAAYKAVEVIGDLSGPFTVNIRAHGPLGPGKVTLEIASEIYDENKALVDLSTEVALTVLTAYSATAINEIQMVTLTNGPHAGGTFTLTCRGETTAGIAYNATAAAVKSALEALGNIDTDDITVTGNAGGPYTITFVGSGSSLAGEYPPMSGSGASLTGAFGTFLTGDSSRVTIVQQAKAAVNEQQMISLTGNPTGGTFTLTFNAETTGTINYNSSSAALNTSLVALATPVSGDFSITGPDGGPWLIEFTGAYAASDVSLITGNAGSLTADNTQALVVASNTVDPTGPYHWDDANNWSGGAVPSGGDIVYVQNISTDIKYGLGGISGTLAELHFMASFTGKFGLKPVNENGYYEYRTTSGTVKSTLVMIGEGDGPGSPFISINASSVQTELIVTNTGSPDDTTIPALLWKGTHASNVVRLFKGSFGCALLVGEVATIATLQIGYLTDREADVQYAIGPGITPTTIQISGGDGHINLGTANASALTLTGGRVVLSGSYGVSTTFAIAPDNEDTEATVVWNTTGTLGGAPIVSGAGKLDFSQDMRTKTVTNPIEVNGKNAIVDDPFQVVSNLRLDLNYCVAELNSSRLGNNVRITRGTPS